MNKAGEVTLNPPLILNNLNQPTQSVAAHYVVDNEGSVKSAGSARQKPNGAGAVGLPGAALHVGSGRNVHVRPDPNALSITSVQGGVVISPVKTGQHQAGYSISAGKASEAAQRPFRTAFTLNTLNSGFSPNSQTKAGSNPPRMEIVVTQAPTSANQTCVKMTPKFFNLNAVANINKSLNNLVTHDQPGAPWDEAQHAFLPIITHVESLAPNNLNSDNTTSPRINLWAGNQNTPPRPLTGSGQTTITAIPTQTPHALNAGQQDRHEHTQCNVSYPNASHGMSLPGSFLTTQSGFILQRTQTTSETQAQFQVMNQQDGSQMSVLMTSQQAAAIQNGPMFLRQNNVLQVNSVQAGAPQTSSLLIAPQSAGVGQGQLTMSLLNQQLLKTNALQVNSRQPCPNSIIISSQDVPSVLKANQMSSAASEPRNIVQLNANLQANFLNSMQALPQPNSMLISNQGAQSNLNNAVEHPGPRRLPAGPPAPAPPGAAALRPMLCFEKLEPALPPAPAREWVAGRDPTALTVLGAGAGVAWRVAAHLVLSDVAAPHAAAVFYALQPLQRLILPEEEEKTKLKEKQRQEKEEKKSGPETESKDKGLSVSWLKVRSFAKMGNDVAQEADNTQDDVEMPLKAPPRVYLENKVYVKMCEVPLTYAKVLHDVRGPAACRALLLRREPVFLYSPRTHALTRLDGEPSADASTIKLTAPKEVFGVMHELAAYLGQPPPPPPPPPPGPARPARPGDPAIRAKFKKLMKYVKTNKIVMNTAKKGGTFKLRRGAIEPLPAGRASGQGGECGRAGGPGAAPAPAQVARADSLVIDLGSSGEE